ncbi:hypothetical protein E2C01_026999 [Portunus trituberculatus]|uniref:Uncharacterized protein n=1 Tax=Portunus trituberculatus TaxID=210409 RepID=A0A5B7EKS6_PORTR|nr:hypothetical protein [Portunus trituberculatus]
MLLLKEARINVLQVVVFSVDPNTTQRKISRQAANHSFVTWNKFTTVPGTPKSLRCTKRSEINGSNDSLAVKGFGKVATSGATQDAGKRWRDRDMMCLWRQTDKLHTVAEG